MISSWQGKVAVISGAASGIGRALARKAYGAGMKLALCDVRNEPLQALAAEFGDAENVWTMSLDMRDAMLVQAFADKALRRFGAVDLLFNNAGVGGGGKFLEIPRGEWEWIIGVNLWGCLNCMFSFLPSMRARGSGHIVNTASIAGMASSPEMGPYNVSKHAVVTISETLYGELRNEGSALGISVLCPSFINTNIWASARYRELYKDETETDRSKLLQSAEEMSGNFMQSAGMAPERVAELVFDGIDNKRFYIFTHPQESRRLIEQRMNAILNDAEPPMQGSHEFPIDFN